MTTIKKKDFADKPLEEFVDGEGGMIGGDRNVTGNSEIETGPVMKPYNDDSDYEKGVSTTTNRAVKYRQNIPWFARYAAGQRGRTNETSKIITKRSMEEKVEDLVKKNSDNEVMSKDYNNNFEKVKRIINDNSFTVTQLDELSSIIKDKKTDTSKVKNI